MCVVAVHGGVGTLLPHRHARATHGGFGVGAGLGKVGKEGRGACLDASPAGWQRHTQGTLHEPQQPGFGDDVHAQVRCQSLYVLRLNRLGRPDVDLNTRHNTSGVRHRRASGVAGAASCTGMGNNRRKDHPTNQPTKQPQPQPQRKAYLPSLSVTRWQNFLMALWITAHHDAVKLAHNLLPVTHRGCHTVRQFCGDQGQQTEGWKERAGQTRHRQTMRGRSDGERVTPTLTMRRRARSRTVKMVRNNVVQHHPHAQCAHCIHICNAEGVSMHIPSPVK